MNPFENWPIGAIIFDAFNFRVEKITAHIEDTWHASNSPWYGIEVEVLAGSVPPLLMNNAVPNERFPNRRIVAGERANQARATIHCLNGCEPDLTFVARRGRVGAWLVRDG